MHSTVDDIVTAGQNALVSPYGRKPGENLDNVAYDTNACKKLPCLRHRQPERDGLPTS